MNSESITFFKKVKYFLTDYLIKQRGASQNTIKSYKDTLNQFLKFIQETQHIELSDITFDFMTKETVLAYLNWLEEVSGNTVSTRNQRLACIHSFIDQASGNDLVLKSKLIEIKEIYTKKNVMISTSIKFFGDTVLKTILEQPDQTSNKGIRDLFLMSIMYDTAARIQEILDLKTDSIHLDSSLPYVTIKGKGCKIRIVPLMPNTIDLFEKYKSIFHESSPPNSPLFYVMHNSLMIPMSQDCVAKFIDKYRKAAKRFCSDVPDKITPHMFRHSRAMSLYRGGMPLPLLSEWLGHSNLQTSLIYANADTKMKHDAIEKATTELSPLKNKLQIKLDTNDEKILKKLYGLD
jgi:site-specific recombinase XerD